MAKRGNGEGSAPRQRADGRWAVNIRQDGKRVTLYGKTAADVRRKAREASRRVETGAPVKDASTLLVVYVGQWLDSTLAASDRRPSTKDLYKTLSKNFTRPEQPLADLSLAKVTPQAVERWLSWMKERYADSTVRSTYVVLRAVLDTAVRDGLLASNPAAKVTRPKVEHTEARFLVPSEVARLRTAMEGSRYAGVVDLLLLTGMRRGEALALRWEHVDTEARVARVVGTLARQGGVLRVTPPKTARGRRSVPLSASAVAVLESARHQGRVDRLAAGSLWQDTGFVFVTETGTPLDPRNTLRALTAAATKAGLEDVALHTLRHTAASVMLSSGVALKVVSDILGHGSISVTADLYGHLQPDVAASAMDALDVGLRG